MNLKTIIRITPVFILVLYQSCIVSGQKQQSWQANKEIIEKLTKAGTGFNYYEEKVPAYHLPDLLTSEQGVRIVSADLWNNVRRPEIIEQFRKNVFGRIPSTPYQEKFKLVSLDNLLGA